MKSPSIESNVTVPSSEGIKLKNSVRDQRISRSWPGYR